MSISSTRSKPKWHHHHHPKILNLPSRRKLSTKHSNSKGKLESLFDQEREFSKTFPAVVLLSCGEGVEERYNNNGVFETEILRAECNFLRMERDFAFKKLETNKVKMDRALSSALHTLLSGRKKIYQGQNMGLVLEEEIGDLAEKLEELQRSCGVKEHDVKKCGNFDKKASILQRRLEKLGGLTSEKCSEHNSEMAASSLSSINGSLETDKESFVLGCSNSQTSSDVEILRTKMEGLSKGMLERMQEECGSMLSSTTANSSVASSASTSKRIEFPDSSSFSTRQTYQETVPREENKCSGRCKAVVRRIVEQVRAETEQWSQMQEMLGQVREEMEELQTSRDFWEDCALKYDEQIQSLHSEVQEWTDRAHKSETKANELQTEVDRLKAELEYMRVEPRRVSVTPQDLASSSLCKQLEKEKQMRVSHIKASRTTSNVVQKQEFIEEKSRIEQELVPISLGRQLEKEKKRIYFCRVKENHRVNEQCSKEDVFSEGRRKSNKCSKGFMTHRRQVFGDIGNFDAMVRENGNDNNAVLPMHCNEAIKTEERW